jgi:glycerophosphoryl diester phosphodiesterase
MFAVRPVFAVLLLLCCVACSGPGTGSEQAEKVGAFNEAVFALHGAENFYSWTSDRIPMVSAHRGGPYPGYPENAIETFEFITEITPAVIECDIAMTKDSVLILMHDNTLDRTTTGTGSVQDYLWSELQELRLVDLEGTVTAYRIPTLGELLDWTPGKALLTLDVKRGVPFEKVIEEVQQSGTGTYAAIITYNANDARKVYELDSSLMISVGIGNREAYEAHRSLGIPDENMIAFVGVAEPDEAHYRFLHDKGIYCILGVLGNLDKKAEVKGDALYADFVERGADILATDRPVEAAAAIKTLIPETSSKRQYFNGY